MTKPQPKSEHKPPSLEGAAASLQDAYDAIADAQAKKPRAEYPLAMLAIETAQRELRHAAKDRA